MNGIIDIQIMFKELLCQVLLWVTRSVQMSSITKEEAFNKLLDLSEYLCETQQNKDRSLSVNYKQWSRDEIHHINSVILDIAKGLNSTNKGR